VGATASWRQSCSGCKWLGDICEGSCIKLRLCTSEVFGFFLVLSKREKKKFSPPYDSPSQITRVTKESELKMHAKRNVHLPASETNGVGVPDATAFFTDQF